MKSIQRPLVPSGSPAVSALRRSRRAIEKVDHELDGILGQMNGPDARPDANAADRLAAHMREADDAMGSVTELYASSGDNLY